MKTVIRRSIFETNSSSTHSLSYVPGEDEDGNEGFTFECKSPAARLLMIKAQVNHVLGDLGEARKPHEYIVLVRAFYDECVALFCEREGVDPATLEDYLLAFAKKTFYYDVDRHHNWYGFKEYYNDKSCDLCTSFFECGPLDCCNCLYENVKEFVRGFFGMDKGAPDLKAKAEALLYGPNDFVCTEYYGGFKLLDSGKTY